MIVLVEGSMNDSAWGPNSSVYSVLEKCLNNGHE